MNDDEQQAEIAAMVMERNSVRRDVNCLENKLDRIKHAMSLVQSGLGTDRKLVAIQGGGLPLPPIPPRCLRRTKSWRRRTSSSPRRPVWTSSIAAWTAFRGRVKLPSAPPMGGIGLR